jgi:hypothetical protein
MLALLGVWVALLSLLVSLTMLLFRPAFTDVTVTLVLYFGAPGALCLGGVVLWTYRKEPDNEPGIHAQRVQAAAAIGLAIAAAAIVYGLIIGSQKIERIDGQAPASYNSLPGKPNPVNPREFP